LTLTVMISFSATIARCDMNVDMPETDWKNVVLLLTEIRDSDRFSLYLDHIIDSIDQALDKQEA
jgi:hypothetical protein